MVISRVVDRIDRIDNPGDKLKRWLEPKATTWNLTDEYRAKVEAKKRRKEEKKAAKKAKRETKRETKKEEKEDETDVEL